MASKYDIVCKMNQEELGKLVKGEVEKVDLSADLRLVTDRKSGGGSYHTDKEGRVSGSINADGIAIVKYLHAEFKAVGDFNLSKGVLRKGSGAGKKAVSIDISKATPEQIEKLKALGLIA